MVSLPVVKYRMFQYLNYNQIIELIVINQYNSAY
jgi:hypothetical protein